MDGIDMPDYKDGKIYRLICNITGLIYYGSTTKTLNERKTGHKADYNRFLNGNSDYYTSFKIIENDDYKIELVELFPCNDRKELETREGFYIKNSECINKITVTQTRKEYRELHKNEIKEYRKIYYEDNKDKLNSQKRDYMKIYNEKNKEKIKEKYTCICGSNIRKSHKLRHERSKKHLSYIASL